MTKTEHYQLNQWDASDYVRREDFNEDNRKIEEALADMSNGIPKIATGSYTGTGTYGADHPNRLTFDFKPTLVLLFCPSGQNANAVCFPNKNGTVYPFTNNTGFTVFWEGNTLFWYHYSDSIQQYNGANYLYYYMAV